MNKNKKKEIFLKIIEAIFDDISNDIDYNNSILFYHFLVSTLENEITSLPVNEENDLLLCISIVELLCNFDIIDKTINLWSKEAIKEYLKDFSGISEFEFELSISKFRKIYILMKNDFLLNLQ